MSDPMMPARMPDRCERCGSERLVADKVRRAFTEGGRIVVVEGIPAVVCRNCGAQYEDASTATVIDVLRGEGFPTDRAVGSVEVPVFRFGDHTAKG